MSRQPRFVVVCESPTGTDSFCPTYLHRNPKRPSPGDLSKWKIFDLKSTWSQPRKREFGRDNISSKFYREKSGLAENGDGSGGCADN